MKISALLQKLKQAGILIRLNGEQLAIQAPDGNLSPELLQELKEQKEAVISFLKDVAAEDYNPIPAIAVQPHYALSHAQKRLWIVEQLEGISSAYNMSVCYRMKGRVDQPAFAQAFQQLIERYEILRTSFRFVNIEPRQFIHVPGDCEFTIQFQDLRKEHNAVEKALQFSAASAVTPFDLVTPSQVRALLQQLGDEDHLFTFTMHHIISDEWSMQVLVKEIVAIYNTLLGKESNSLLPVPVQFKDYAAWQEDQMKGTAYQSHRQYWLKLFEEEIPVLELPTDRQRPAVKSYTGSKETFLISPEQSAALISVCQQHGATLFMGMLALLKILFYRYTGQKDLVIGSPVAGREHPQLEEQVGFYVNTIAFRQPVDPKQEFGSLLEDTRQMVIETLGHQDYPFDTLVEELSLRTDRSRSPLFDYMIVQRTTRGEQEELKKLNGIQLESVHLDTVFSKFDITFAFEDTDAGILLELEYNTDLFNRERILKLGEHFLCILQAVLLPAPCRIGSIDYISEKEKEQLRLFSGYGNIYTSSPDTLVSLFEKQVSKTPLEDAVICGIQKMSFDSLNKASNRLAHYLRKKHNAGPGQLIGLLMDRSEWMLAGLLGILKSGAAYVPIEPAYPPDRINYILEDAGIKVLVTDNPAYALKYAAISPDDSMLLSYPDNNPSYLAASKDLAYVIYTSGSTGQPKGVLIEHHSIVNYLQWANAYYFNNSNHHPFAVFTSLSFDLTITSLLSGLYRGDCAWIFQGDEPDNVLQTIFTHSELKAVKLTPSHISLLGQLAIPEASSGITHAIVGGEAFTKGQVEILRRLNPSMHIYNEYGPTETTVGCTVSEIDDANKITIGRPIAHTKAFVLNEYGEFQPIGIAGELWIGGDGVGRGYHQRKELTSDKFVSIAIDKERLYRTGDLVRWLADGQLDFIGRADEQVKIRGYRIEPGEIEQVMMNYDGLKEAVVLPVTLHNEKILVAYYTTHGHDLPGESLRKYLKDRLPAYMVPLRMIQLSSFPLTVNGKLDKDRLPVTELAGHVSYLPPVTPAEIELAKIWRSILGIKQVGKMDSFFDLGGHSLNAMQLIAAVYKIFSVKLELRDVFAFPVFMQLAEKILIARREEYKPIERVPSGDTYPLSFSQNRLYLQQEQQPGLTAFHIPAAFRMHGPVNVAALKFAFRSLVERHESLRTVFEVVEGEPRQRILDIDNSGFDAGYIDLREEEQPLDKAMELTQELASSTFDLMKGPLLKVLLLQTADQEFILAFNMHHIVSDDWSMQILVREVVMFYYKYLNPPGPVLSPLSLQYRDYAAWQLSELSGERLADHHRYWLEQLSGVLPSIDLPADRPRPTVQTFHGNHLSFELPATSAALLKEYCQSQGATLFMGLTALVKALLYRYTGQKDIIIGTPVAGRDHPDLEGQIGYYLNTLALRTQVDSGAGFSSLLLRVKETTVEGFSHQVYPFDRLVEELDIARDLSRTPVFDVVIIHQNIQLRFEKEWVMEGVSIETIDVDLPISKGDLRFQFVESDQIIQADIEYNSDLFDRDRIEKMRHNFLGLLQEVLSDTEKSLQELSYGEEEPGERTLFSSEQNREEYEPVHRVFESRIAEYGEMLALQSAEGEVSYGELNEGSNRLGHMLKDMGLKSGEVVGVLLGGGIRLVESLLGILKSGGVYMPLEQSFSAVRVEQMLEETGCRLLLTGAEDWLWLEGRLSSGGLKGIRVLVVPGYGESSLAGAAGADLPLGITVSEDPVSCLYGGGTEGFIKEGERLLSQYSSQDMEEEVSGDSANYIFYTSGSTGKGKGITGRHRSLSHYVHWHAGYTGMCPGMRVSQLAPVSFDASLKDILPALISGSTVCIVPREVRENMELLGRWLADKEITVLQTVPSLFRMLTRAIAGQGTSLPELKRVVLAGERLYGRDVENWRSCGGREVQLSNLYGLTETTILKSYYDIPADREYQGENWCLLAVR